jgi:hypothetical protein
MKLSDLVAYKTALDKLSTRSAQREVELELGKIAHLVNTQPIQLSNFRQQLDTQYNTINQHIDQFEIQLNELKKSVKLQIEIEEKYDHEIYDLIMETFDALPLAALVDNKILAVHGGISPEL